MATSRKPLEDAPGFGDPTSPQASGSPQDYFGGGTFDADDFETSGSGLTLDTVDDAPARVALPAATSARPASQAAAAGAPATTARRAWPTAVTPDPTGFQIDRVDVDVVADYGKPPASVVATPLYALRVHRRKGVLTTRVKELAGRLTESEYERDCLVVAMARELRGKILLTEQGEQLFEPVVALERTALERRAALAGKSAEYDDRARELEEKRAAVEREVALQNGVVEQRSAVVSEQRRLHDRAEAKKKRLFIEVRTIVEATEKAGGSSKAQTDRLAELEADIASQKIEVEGLASRVTAAQGEQSTAEAELHKLEKKLRDAARLHKELDREFQKEIGTRTEGVSEADKHRFDALLAVGRAVLASKGRVVEVAADVLDGILRAESTVLGRATDLEKVVRAVDSYDAGASQRGLVTGIALVIALIVVMITLATR